MKHNYLILLVLIITFFSCEEEVTLPTIDEITVEAFLHAGQALDTVTFSKVIPFDSVEALVAPNDLSPIVIDEDGFSYPLYYLGENGKYGNTELIIETEKSYRLELDYKGQTISAETFIPTAPQNITLTDTLIRRTKIIDFTDLFDQELPQPIEVEWETEENAWYFVEVRSIEDDPEPINQLFEEEDIDFSRPTFITEPTTDPYYLINLREITHFGKYEVIVYRVNAEYVALYEDNTASAGSLNEIRTNVQNGFGIFTGVNSTRRYFEVREQ
ncbi:MAG: DUF4249 family protein [Bacteroidota bacterium]